MKKISLDKINEKALYRVVQIEELPHLFYIHTDFDVDYEISIKQSTALVQSGCYTLNIRNIWGQKSPGDAKFKQTLIAIVEEFFSVYNDVLLYITETEDNKQAFRDRLFVRWFNTYVHRDQFYIQSAQGKMDGKMNFMATLQFVVNVPIENIDLGDLKNASLADATERIRQAVKAISESKEIREEYAKFFCEELGSHVDHYSNVLDAIDKGMKNVRIKGLNGLNYKQMIEDRMPVTFDSVGIEDGNEVERMWLADFVDGKWVEDYVVVRREAYDIETDNDGAVFALILNGRMLVKAPNVKYYRIPEDVYRIADHAFKECTELEELDVPYTINDYEIAQSFDHSCVHPKLHLWDWAYDCTRSEELEKEIAVGWTDEYGFVYSQDRKRLLKAPPEWKEYWIPEGVEKIDRLAFIGCKWEDLHIPYTCKMDDWPLEKCPVFGSERVQGCIWPWEKPYSEKNSEFYL